MSVNKTCPFCGAWAFPEDPVCPACNKPLLTFKPPMAPWRYGVVLAICLLVLPIGWLVVSTFPREGVRADYAPFGIMFFVGLALWALLGLFKRR